MSESISLFDTLLDLVVEDAPSEEMPPVALRVTRVRHEGRPWLFHTCRVPDEMVVAPGERVIFEVPGDSAFGCVVEAPALRLVTGDPTQMPVLKHLSAREVADIAERVSRRESEAFAWFRERIVAHRLPMKPVHIEMSALQGRVVFYFWAESRVDFRNLLQDLRKRVQGNIELAQVGAHEAARQIGGIGRCHREVCSRVMPSYPPVSPKHARVQGLSPNPQKHLGVCGRLMGCLAHEQEQYLEARKGLPKEGKTVETPIGKGVIKELDILRARVRVRTEDGQWGTFHVSELKRDGKPLMSQPEPAGDTVDTMDTMDRDAEWEGDFEMRERALEATWSASAGLQRAPAASTAPPLAPAVSSASPRAPAEPERERREPPAPRRAGEATPSGRVAELTKGQRRGGETRDPARSKPRPGPGERPKGERLSGTGRGAGRGGPPVEPASPPLAASATPPGEDEVDELSSRRYDAASEDAVDEPCLEGASDDAGPEGAGEGRPRRRRRRRRSPPRPGGSGPSGPAAGGGPPPG